ncbi:MAG: hypothetical protein Q7S27_06850 [Nanoarchaeota archaeon]|nr:hypothetical protein [Nanoarchaeota archaeon]
MTEKQNVTVELDSDNIPLDRSDLRNVKKIKSLEGMCSADKSDPENCSGMRTIEQYKKEVLNPGIESGKIGDGVKSKWDDRKLRYDNATINGEDLEVKFGVSHFKEVKDDIVRDRNINEYLMEIGKKRFDNQYAFFERGPGVTVIPITKDGSIYLAERGAVDTGIGLLNGAAGNISYKDNITLVNPLDEAKKEFLEEMGVKAGDIRSMPLIGLYGDRTTGEIDFTYLATIKLTDKELMDAWDGAKDKAESSRRIRIPDYKSLMEIVTNGKIKGSDKRWELMYATRGGLESILPSEINS